MAFTDVIPEIAGARFRRYLQQEDLFMSRFANWQFMRPLSEFGDTVTVPYVPTGYQGGLGGHTVLDDAAKNASIASTYGLPGVGTVEVKFTSFYTWGLEVPDHSVRLMRPSLLGPTLEKQARDLSRQQQRDVIGSIQVLDRHLDGTGTDVVIGSPDTDSELDLDLSTGDDIRQSILYLDWYVGLIAGMQDSFQIPPDGRWLVVSPALRWIAELAIGGSQEFRVRAGGALSNSRTETSMLGIWHGFEVYVSVLSDRVDKATVTKTGTGSAATFAQDGDIVWGNKYGYAMLRALGEVESLRLEDKFATGIRQLYLLGGSFIEPQGFGTAAFTISGVPGEIELGDEIT